MLSTFREGVVVLKELSFNSFYLLEDVVMLKELISTVSTLGESVVVLKELIFNSFYIGRMGGFRKNRF